MKTFILVLLSLCLTSCFFPTQDYLHEYPTYRYYPQHQNCYRPHYYQSGFSYSYQGRSPYYFHNHPYR